MKFCHNCSSNFHKTKECVEPKISCGLILTKINNFPKINNNNSYYKIDDYNFKNLKNLNKISKYSDKITFLLIRRKHSLNYIEFIRGKYIINKNILTYMFELMCPDEINLISTHSFHDLWEKIWGDKSWCKSFEKEYKNSENKFNKLQSNTELFIFLTKNVFPKYNSPEWGLPKGRRDSCESNLECAVREFTEETSLSKNHFNILNKVSPINEIFYGTNNIKYKSIFYLANLNKNKYILDIKNNNETGDIGFFTLQEATKLFRNYHKERINIIEKTFLFFINIIENNKLSNLQKTIDITL